MAESIVNTDKTHRGPPSCFSSLVRDMMDGGVDIDEAQPSDLDVTLAGILIRTAYKGGTVDGLRDALERNEKMATIKDTARDILDKPIKKQDIIDGMEKIGIEDPTMLDYLTTLILTRTVSNGDVRDLVALAELLGDD